MPLPRILGTVAGAGAAAAVLTTAYAAWEARAYTLREVAVPLLPPGAQPLRVLHLSDLHLTPGQRRKQDWLRDLGSLRPDLVIDTGDHLAHPESVPVVHEALVDLLDRPGVFVFGSNDYYSPVFKNPAKYLLPDDGTRTYGAGPLPWRDLQKELAGAGWLDLSNATGDLTIGGLRFFFGGVDDAHLSYDRFDLIAGAADTSADVRIGVTHAPYLRVLDAFAADGYDAVFAGHTHGGQVCLPGLGALTTNCDLDNARAKGLHRHPPRSAPGDPGSCWLHVSAGVGTSPFARIRVACRPEATLLTLTARSSGE